uniref:Uncharacterized protein n=1 Tax=Peronospora matthiolae TaxID=2874970 RepID=A0AAV1T317_9STRA
MLVRQLRGRLAKRELRIQARTMTRVLLLVAALATASARSEVINQSAKRTLDLTKHVVHEYTEFQFSDTDAAVHEYDVAFPHALEMHLANVSARCGKAPCEIVPAASKKDAAKTSEDAALYTVLLKSPLRRERRDW